jgi:hypothetical protein
MKALQVKSRKTHLIWLVSIALLFSPGMGDAGNGSTIHLRHLKQTELTLTTQYQRSDKKSLSAFSESISKHAISFSGNLFFLTRISRHTQVAALKWKISGNHILSPLIKIAHAKIAQNDDDDLSLLKG